MNKELLISIKPEHLVNILNGQKTRELRTRVPKDYKGLVNIYCTKSSKNILYKYKDIYYTQHYLSFTDDVDILNGKVIARFWFDEYIELEHYDFWGESYYWKNTVISAFELEKATCMSSFEMEEYAKGKTLYAWHIKDLEIFDKPKELSEFSVERPPQSYQFVYVIC